MKILIGGDDDGLSLSLQQINVGIKRSSLSSGACLTRIWIMHSKAEGNEGEDDDEDDAKSFEREDGDSTGNRRYPAAPLALWSDHQA